MKTTHVAVGVIQNCEGDICVAKRPDGKHLSGYWEFPGGKVEFGESCFEALKRELAEELGIDIESSAPLIEIHHTYPEKKVCLDVHSVSQFTGEASGREGQEVQWVSPSDLKTLRFPEANKAIVDAILNR